MRRMSKVWWALVVGVSLGVTLVGVKPAKAAPLTTVNSATYSSWLGPVAAPPMTNTFDFEPTNATFPGPDGEVLSVVYYGAGAATGFYVYVYQITHYAKPPSSEGSIEGMSFDIFGPLNTSLLNPGTVAFQVEDTGDLELESATLAPPGAPPAIGTIKFTVKDEALPPNQTTWLFGFFSPLPPTKVVADMKNTGNTILSPLVYTPSPEPSTFVLLGMSLLGGIWWRRRLK